MIVAIDARNLVGPFTGATRYIIEMSRALVSLSADVRLYLPSAQNVGVGDLGVPYREGRVRRSFSRVMWGERAVPRWAQEDQVDLIWGPAHRLPRNRVSGIAKVVTIHDLAWFHRPDLFGRPWIPEKILMDSALNSADAVICVSETTRDAVLAYSRGKLSAPVTTIYPGASTFPLHDSDIMDRLNIRRQFVLAVGTREPRKNFHGLIRAYASIDSRAREKCALVIVGRRTERDSLEDLTAQLGVRDSVLLVGPVSDADLGTLYRRARFLALVSFYEGFGLPIVEAHSAGIPVLTSKTWSLGEIGGKAAYYVDPEDIRSIASGLSTLILDDECYRKLAEYSISNARRFNWQYSAAATLELFRRTIEGVRGRM